MTRFLQQLDYLADKFNNTPNCRCEQIREDFRKACTGPTVRDLIGNGYLSDPHTERLNRKATKLNQWQKLAANSHYGRFSRHKQIWNAIHKQATTSRLIARGWQFAKNLTIGGKRKTMLVKTVRAARKINGRVEFYNKQFVMLINSAGLVVYSNA